MDSLLPSFSIACTISTLLVIASITIAKLRRSTAFPRGSPPRTADQVLPVLGSAQFFSRRWTFFKKQRALSATGNFSFWVGGLKLVGLTGLEGREHLLVPKSGHFRQTLTLALRFYFCQLQPPSIPLPRRSVFFFRASTPLLTDWSG